jgi:hypothetical protein
MKRFMTDSDPADDNNGNLLTTNQSRSREVKYNEMKKELAAALQTIEESNDRKKLGHTSRSATLDDRFQEHFNIFFYLLLWAVVANFLATLASRQRSKNEAENLLTSKSSTHRVGIGNVLLL